MEIKKLLESGTKSTELKALAGFAIFVIYQIVGGDHQIVSQITGAEGGAKISELFALMQAGDTKTVDLLQLLLYAVLGYFAKRGLLKWKELDKLADIQKAALEITAKVQTLQYVESVAAPLIKEEKAPLPGGSVKIE